MRNDINVEEVFDVSYTDCQRGDDKSSNEEFGGWGVCKAGGQHGG